MSQVSAGNQALPLSCIVIAGIAALVRGDHARYEIEMQRLMVGQPIRRTAWQTILICAAVLKLHGDIAGRAWGAWADGDPTVPQQLGVALLVAAVNDDREGLRHAIDNADPAELVVAIRVTTHTAATHVHLALHHHEEP